MTFNHVFRLITFGLVISSAFTKPVDKLKSGYDPKVFYNVNLFEGDIMLRHLNPNASNFHAIAEDGSLWTGNQLIYELDDSAIENSFFVQQAMEHITSSTDNCITFKQRSMEDFNYVNIFGGSGCFSEVGMKGGEQQLSLGNGCGAVGVAIHELLHSLGFYHHHSRSDRDEYLNIHWENIQPEATVQFNKLSESENRLLTSFDYDSIMMYGSLAFSNDGFSKTMEPVQPFVEISDPGYKYGMSPNDIEALKKLYNCA